MAQGEGNRDTPVLRGNASTSDFYVDGVRDDVQYMRDVYNLDRVEVVKGPNAMLFGRGGGGGIINRITRQAEWGQTREVVVQGGSYDNRRVTADLGTALTDAAAVRVTGVFEDSGTYRRGVGIERYGLNPSVALRLGPATTLRASFEHFHDERTADRGLPSFDGRPVESDPRTFFGDPNLSPVDATVKVLSSVFEHRFPGRVALRNRLSYGDYDKFYQNVFPGGTTNDGAAAVINAYNNATDRRNLFNQTDVIFTPRAGGIEHTVLAGVELGRQVTDNFRSTGFFTSIGQSATAAVVPIDAPTVSLPVTFRQSATDADNHGVATLAAVYLQDQVALTPHVQAVAGLRFDAFDVTFTNNRTGVVLTSRDRLLSPRLGLVVKPRTAVSVYGSSTLTYLPRSGDQLSSLSLTTQALDPETFRNYEAGVKWDVRPALALGAAVYRLNRGNVAVPDPADPSRSLLVDAQRMQGLEVELRGAVTPAWSLTAGYALQDGEITRSLSASAQAGAVLAQVPRHSLSLWNKYNVSARWAVGLGVVQRTRMFASTDNRVALPGFTRADGAVFFTLSPELLLQVNVENLFDAPYFLNAHNNHNITPGAPRALRAAITARF
jgi:catecholate siderophore receptor